MTSSRPTVLISNVLPHRPGDAMYDAIAARLWDRLIEAAAPRWNIVREYGQLDGPEGAVLRAKGADAIVLMGGEDVHPACYGGARGYAGEGRHCYRADLAHIALARYAVRTSTPLLGICRGMQILSVAFGGTLEQHIDSGAHTNPGILADHRFVRHAVSVDPFSRLAAALGGLVARPVSSAHHQRIDRVGEGLRVVARAADSTIEAIEGETAPVLGVQWHPEDPAADIAPLRRLLAALEPGSFERGASVLPSDRARRPALVA